jgi:hypothetical protein
MNRINPALADPEVRFRPPSTPLARLPLAPRLMLAFWMLLGSVAGINLALGIWRVAELSVEAFALAVPVGALVGAVGGGLVGQITKPRLLVLVMAMLAGWSMGALVGGFGWAELGQIAGGLTGSLTGGLIWAAWLLSGRGSAGR